MEQNILVVGDWTLDEQWVTGKHTISTSSRTGDFQRYIRNDSTLNTVYVGGLGRVARQFIQERKKNDGYKIFVIGKWNDRDTSQLRTLCEEKEENNFLRNEFFINWDYPRKDKVDEDYFYLRNILDPQYGFYTKNEIETKHRKEICTTRAIRIYEEEGRKIKLLERVDFDIPENHLLLSDKKKLERSKDIDKDIFPPSEEIGILVIKDLNKGMICDNVINLLIKSRLKFIEK